MPNHITSRLHVEGKPECVKGLFDFIKSDAKDEDGDPILVDFNKILPMPSELDVESSTDGEDGKKYLLGHSGDTFQIKAYEESEHSKKMETMKEEWFERFEKCINLGRQYLRNIDKYGQKDWYDWRLANWGTKWNAYDVHKEDDNTIYFNTAWSGVPNLISMLAAKFPELTIKYDFADENIGYNVGSYIMNGECVENNSPADNSAEALELVFELGLADRGKYNQ